MGWPRKRTVARLESPLPPAKTCRETVSPSSWMTWARELSPLNVLDHGQIAVGDVCGLHLHQIADDFENPGVTFQFIKHGPSRMAGKMDRVTAILQRGGGFR